MNPPSTASKPSGNPEEARWFADEIYPHEPSLKSYLRQSFPSVRADVDDVVQESYVRIWKSRAGQPLQSAKAFLFKIAHNVMLDLLRRNSISPITAIGDLAALPVIEEKAGIAQAVSKDESIRFLIAGLATLPSRSREVIMLRKLKGLSQKEAAAQLGISEKTVDEHLSRGIKRLGKYLRQRGVCSYYER